MTGAMDARASCCCERGGGRAVDHAGRGGRPAVCSLRRHSLLCLFLLQQFHLLVVDLLLLRGLHRLAEAQGRMQHAEHALRLEETVVQPEGDAGGGTRREQK